MTTVKTERAPEVEATQRVTLLSGLTDAVRHTVQKLQGNGSFRSLEDIRDKKVPSLRQGAEGENVAQLQELLGRLHDKHPNSSLQDVKVDGEFGPRTTAAVRAFQQEFNLEVDGVFGKSSAEMLLAALEGKISPGSTSLRQKKEYRFDNGHLTVSSVPLDFTRLQATAARTNPLANVALQRDKDGAPVEYTAKVLVDGKVETMGPLYRSRYSHEKLNGSLEGEYYKPDGTEVWLSALKNGVFQRHTVQKAGAWRESGILELKDGTYLVPSPHKDFDQARKILAKEGLEVLGVAGTGYVGGAVDQKPQRFAYIDLGKPGLSAEDFRSLENWSATQRYKSDGTLMNTGGYYVTREGQVKLLDITGSTNTMVKRLVEQLQQEGARAISFFGGGTLIREGDVASRGRGAERGEARSFLAFNKEGELLGMGVTPPIATVDSFNVAKQKFGSSLDAVVMMDGDYYAGMYVSGEERFSRARMLTTGNAQLIVRRFAEPERGRIEREATRPSMTTLDKGETLKDRALDFVDDAFGAIREKGLIEGSREIWEKAKQRFDLRLPF